MRQPKPRRNCKECKKPLLSDDLPRGKYPSGKVCSFKCAANWGRRLAQKKQKKLKLEPGTELTIGNDNRFVSKSQIKRIAIQTKSLPKDPKDRDPEYREFVRQFDCVVMGCKGKEIHAHHAETGGMGIKGSDYSCIPVCPNHHTGGNESIHQCGPSIFEMIHKLDIRDFQIRLLRRYVKVLRNVSMSRKVDMPPKV